MVIVVQIPPSCLHSALRLSQGKHVVVWRLRRTTALEVRLARLRLYSTSRHDPEPGIRSAGSTCLTHTVEPY